MKLNKDHERELNRILDKVTVTGYSSLSKDEQSFLDDCSNERTPIVVDEDVILTEESVVEFLYDGTRRLEDFMYHHGKITFEGDVYTGMILCDEHGRFIGQEFYDEETESIKFQLHGLDDLLKEQFEGWCEELLPQLKEYEGPDYD